MFDMALLLFILIKSVAQKRIILENCIYVIVHTIVESIDDHVENGTWTKISSSKPLYKIFQHYKKMYNENNNDQKLDLFSFHFLNLFENMRKIDHMLVARRKLEPDAIKPKERIDELIEQM